jgi:hypothetical protein
MTSLCSRAALDCRTGQSKGRYRARAASILFLSLLLPCSHTYRDHCASLQVLRVESRDFSYAEKERTACKAEQIHKMAIIFTQNGPRLSFE